MELDHITNRKLSENSEGCIVRKFWKGLDLDKTTINGGKMFSI